MSQHKEITKEEAKQRYICSQRVYLSNERRTLWPMTPAGYYGSHAPLEELFYRTIPWGEGEAVFFKSLLTPRDKVKIANLNVLRGNTISQDALIGLMRRHRKLRKEGDEHRMALIEYRLDDLDMHDLSQLFDEGKYEIAKKKIKERYE